MRGSLLSSRTLRSRSLRSSFSPHIYPARTPLLKKDRAVRSCRSDSSKQMAVLRGAISSDICRGIQLPKKVVPQWPRQSKCLWHRRRGFVLRVCCSGEGKEAHSHREHLLTCASLVNDEVAKDKVEPAVHGDKEAVADGWFSWNWSLLERVPPRYKIIGATSLAFVICNMDKVNLSVAIIPMSHQFGWNSSTAGLVQSSFFWGYAVSQLPGGWLSKIFGGRKVLEVGVLIWSFATAFVPFVAGFMPALVVSRILVGIGEGVSPSAATDLIARSVPLQERSRAVAVVFGGLSIGSVFGLLLAPSMIENLGWDSVFYVFGMLGILWSFGFVLVEGTTSSGAVQGNVISVAESNPSFSSEKGSVNSSLSESGGSLKDVPWKHFFKNPAVWAMIYAHFCGNWGHYTCLSWLPTYFSEELDLNLTGAAWVSLLPPLGSILVTSIVAPFADSLISNGFETTKVRKICQTIAFLSPAVCMILCSLDLELQPWAIVAILASGLALSSFALSGLYCTHQDISPEYASILLGITNSVGAIPGIIGVSLTGYLLDLTRSWTMSLFLPCIFFYLTGTLVWLSLASSEPQSFSEEQ